MPLLVSPLPASLSPTTSPGRYTLGGEAYDVAIGGLPFALEVGKEVALVRETAPYRKEQVDQSANPGEQSLATWWLRSQSSFHGGAGQVYVDPDSGDELAEVSFDISAGLDVFTPGELKLLPELLAVATVPSGSALMVSAGNSLLVAVGASLYRVDSQSSVTALTWGGTGDIQALATDGSRYFVASTTQLYQGPVNGSASGAAVYAAHTLTGKQCLGWVKARLMWTVGAEVYELDATAVSTAALPAAKFRHPVPGFSWVALADGPQAIFAAGNTGSSGEVHQFILSSDGAFPSVVAGGAAAMLPPGETVTSLCGYVGSFLAIGTNQGLRVAQLAGGGLVYGPHSVSKAVSGVVGMGNTLHVACGAEGAHGVNLGVQRSDGSFASSRSYSTPAHNVATLGSKLVLRGDAGLLVQGTKALAKGSLTTSRIRFRTLENKNFQRVRLRLDLPLPGEVQVEVLDPSGTTRSSVVRYLDGSKVLDEASLQIPAAEWIKLRITLTPDANGVSPVVRGYQVKALPAARRQRLMVLPLRCFDVEQDSTGRSYGYRGYALDRLRQLEEMEQAGIPVLLTHFADYAPDRVHDLVVIDSLRFIQTVSPQRGSTWGGIVQATLRSVT